MKTLLLCLLLSVPAFAGQHHLVNLQWQPSPTPGVDSYAVYRSTVSGGPYQLLGKVPASQLNFVNGSNPDGTPLQEGQQYWYVIVSFKGVQFSPNSNETTQIIPTSPASAQGLSSTVQ